MDELQTFDQVLAAARAGDESAWSAIYRELAPRVLSYLRARRASDVDDLLGEVFMSVARDIGRFTGNESDLRAWVFTIAHHRLVDEARARARLVPVADVPDHTVAAISGGDVELEAVARLSAEDVARLLDLLTEDQREVMLLRILGGLNLKECAEALGKPVGAIKSLQHRAVGALKRALESASPYPFAAAERSDG
jgi:RNA polymerase sigma-70 factor (ECF subfamily)